jgi:hypothetical protein
MAPPSQRGLKTICFSVARFFPKGKQQKSEKHYPAEDSHPNVIKLRTRTSRARKLTEK